MPTAHRNLKRSLLHRVHARGAIVRTDRRRLCAQITTNCLLESEAQRRRCTPLGSFSQDPIGFQAGDANLYRYVGNGPTTRTDPSGLEEVTLDVITFIPAEWVTLVPGIWLGGDGRGPGDTPDGSFRIKSQITFDTDAIGNAFKQRKRSPQICRDRRGTVRRQLVFPFSDN